MRKAIVKLVCRKAKWRKSPIGLFGVNLLLRLLDWKEKNIFARFNKFSLFFFIFFFSLNFSQISTIVLYSPVKVEQVVSMPWTITLVIVLMATLERTAALVRATYLLQTLLFQKYISVQLLCKRGPISRKILLFPCKLLFRWFPSDSCYHNNDNDVAKAFILVNVDIMVIELSGVQFGLKSCAWFQNRTSARSEFDLKSQVWFQTKIARHKIQLPLYYTYFEIRVSLSILIFYFCYFISILMGWRKDAI